MKCILVTAPRGHAAPSGARGRVVNPAMRHDAGQDSEWSAEARASAPFPSLEYVALREEIVKRIEIRFQSVSLTLLVAGTFLTIGLQPDAPPTTLLVYPLVATFLVALWAANDLRIAQIGDYIREKIEPATGAGGWQTYLHTVRSTATYGTMGRLSVFSARGVFVITEIAAVALAFLRFTDRFESARKVLVGEAPPRGDALLLLALLGCDVIALGLTIGFLRGRRPA